MIGMRVGEASSLDSALAAKAALAKSAHRGRMSLPPNRAVTRADSLGRRKQP